MALIQFFMALGVWGAGAVLIGLRYHLSEYPSAEFFALTGGIGVGLIVHLSILLCVHFLSTSQGNVFNFLNTFGKYVFILPALGALSDQALWEYPPASVEYFLLGITLGLTLINIVLPREKLHQISLEGEVSNGHGHHHH